MTQTPRRRVLFLTAGLLDYRVKFHEIAHELAEARGLIYDLAISPPKAKDNTKSQFGRLPFQIDVLDTRIKLGHRELIYQHGLALCRRYDLVILTQETKFLLNYVLKSMPRRARPRLALFGHGRNMQATTGFVDTLGEALKRVTSKGYDWWFAYTSLSRQIMIDQGVDPAKVTDIQNSIDTKQLTQDLLALEKADIDEVVQEFGLGGGPIGLYLGALYDLKRIDFLLEAADHVRRRRPDFQLVLAGDGPMSVNVVEAMETRPWIRWRGVVSGRKKAALLKLADCMLMPGGVGLVVLDAFIAGLPLITTVNKLHGPEIAYLEHGHNGLIVEPGDDPQIYASAVSGLLEAPELLATLSDNARDAGGLYSIENMAERYVEGISAALAL